LSSISLYGFAWNIIGASTPSQIPVAIILHPTLALQALSFQWQLKLLWLFLAFGSTYFISLYFDPPSLFLVAPWLIVSLVSDFTQFYSPYAFYFAFIAFAIFLSSIYAFEKAATLFPRLKVWLVLGLIMTTFAGASSSIYLYAYTPISHVGSTSSWDSVISQVPSSASVITTTDLFSHLATNTHAFQIAMEPNSSQDYSRYLNVISRSHFTYVLLDNSTTNLYDSTATNFLLVNLVCRGDYHQIASAPGISLLEFTQVAVSRPAVCSWTVAV
jgi:hypothetical protein